MNVNHSQSYIKRSSIHLIVVDFGIRVLDMFKNNAFHCLKVVALMIMSTGAFHLQQTQSTAGFNRFTPLESHKNFDSDDNDDCWQSKYESNIRRKFISFSLSMAMSQFFTISRANAACLPGDIREECIGVYKLPMDDAALPYVETPEKLRQYAPDLKFVEPIKYPINYLMAFSQLKEQRQNFDAVQENIARGDIKQAGLILLDIVPKVTAAGRFIVKCYKTAANNERNKLSDSDEAKTLDMKSYRIEYALNECLGYLGETDVLIGQAIRGELGVSAPAQLAILDQLGDARKEFDELLRVVPEQF